VGVSIALHLAVFRAVSSLPMPAPQPSSPSVTRVVWLNELPVAADAEPVIETLDAEVPPETEAPETEAPEAETLEAETPIQAETPPPAAPSEAPPAAPPPEAVAREPERDEDAAEPERPLQVVESESPADPTDGDTPRRNFFAPDIDWEKERRDAVAGVIADGALEDEYATFSLGDRIGEPAEAAPAGPREHIFDTPNYKSRSALTPGRQKTRFGRWAAETCNALSGGGIGLSLFGIPVGSMCAEAGPWADYFADIRPDYLNSRPECAETDESQLSPLAIARRDEISTVKCRMVLQE
jgi:hypothetical protein